MYSEQIANSLKNACESDDVNALNAVLDTIPLHEMREYKLTLLEQFNNAAEEGNKDIVDRLYEVEVVHSHFDENGSDLFEVAKDAAEKYQFSIAEKLFKEPAAKKAGIKNFHRMVYSEDVEGVEAFMGIPMLPNELLLAKNPSFEEMNALQIAFQEKSLEMINTLLEYDAFKNDLFAKDLYGRTVVDLAVDSNFEEGIQLLEEMGYVVSPQDRKAVIDLSQDNIDKKLIKYLDDKGISGSSIVDEEGNCNGWSFLYQIYVTSGREDEFYDVLEVVANWDEDNDSLQNSDLPDSLKSKYKNKEDLFEQIINDLAIYHHDTVAAKELNLGWRQESRLQQYELTKDPKVGRELRKLSHLEGGNVTRDQLVEMIRFFARWPGTSIDIGGGQHATSLFITPEGQFKYFDPNLRNRIATVSTPEEVADLIIKYKYEVLGKSTLDIELTAYKFYEKGAVIPQIEKPTGEFDVSNSANQLSPLHVAVLENDMDKVKALLAMPNTDVNAKDARGNTPLHLALLNKNNELAGEILEHNQVDLNSENNVAARPLTIAIYNNDFPLVEKLIKSGKIDYAQDKGLLFVAVGSGNSQILEALLKSAGSHFNPNETFGDDTPFMRAANKGNVNFVRMLLKEYGTQIDLDGRDFTGETSLMSAARRGDSEMVKLLVEAGANIQLKSIANQTVFDLAKRNPEVLKILNDHQEQVAKQDNLSRETHADKRQTLVFSQVRKPSESPFAAPAKPEVNKENEPPNTRGKPSR
ncbi:MAG: ankyrin repeat domain-containing protein [Candidatus Berkiella sp.]